MHLCMLSCIIHVWLFATRWTVAHQAPLSKGVSGQENWSGLPRLPPEDLPDPRIKPVSFGLTALAGGFFTCSATREPQPTHILPLFYFLLACGILVSWQGIEPIPVQWKPRVLTAGPLGSPTSPPHRILLIISRWHKMPNTTQILWK